jgi:hypothetical protein
MRRTWQKKNLTHYSVCDFVEDEDVFETDFVRCGEDGRENERLKSNEAESQSLNPAKWHLTPERHMFQECGS